MAVFPSPSPLLNPRHRHRLISYPATRRQAPGARVCVAPMIQACTGDIGAPGKWEGGTMQANHHRSPPRGQKREEGERCAHK